MAVPIIEIGDSFVVGFREAELKQKLGL